VVLRSKPVIIGAAINGAQYHPRVNPNIPATAADAVRAALDAHAAGAGYVHVHARERRSGEQFVTLPFFAHVRAELARHAPGLAVSFASSRKGLVADQILSAVAAARLKTPDLSIDQLVDLELLRAIAMDAGPDLMTILTAIDDLMNRAAADDAKAALDSYGSTATSGFTDPELVTAYHRRALRLYEARNIVPEYEVTTIGSLWTLEMLARRQWLPERPHLIFLFGFSARLPLTRPVFDLCMAFARYLRDRHAIQPAVSVGAVMRPQVVTIEPRELGGPLAAGKHDYLELLEWVLGDHTPDCIRVGLEDTPIHFGARVTNADLVALVRETCERAGTPAITDAARVRDAFGLPCPV
jgi:uncharacterized protein (DUF849 family)